VALATWVRLLLTPYLGDRHPFSTFYFAVLLTTVQGGIGPAVLAVVSAVAACDYYFIGSAEGFGASGRSENLGFGLFVSTSAGIVFLGHLLTRARSRAERHAEELAALRDDLERRVLERTEELRRANESLQVSEGRLAGIFRSAMDAIILVDQHETITMLNSAAEDMLGVRAADVVGRRIDTFVPLHARMRHPTRVRDFAARPEGRLRMGERGNITAVCADGREIPVELSLARVDIGDTPYFTVMLRDISRRLSDERALQTSKAQLEEALAAGGMGTWSKDLPDGPICCDDANLAIWGRTREELGEGRLDTVVSWIHPDDRERVAALLGEAMVRGGESRADYRIVRANDDVRWVSSLGRVELDDRGTPTRYTGVTSDITDRKRADEEQLRSQKLEALGTLSGGIAHDFNNIVQAISGNARLSSAELPPDHPAQRGLHEILRATSRASEVVSHILAFSRPHEHQRERASLPAVVDEALTLLHATVPARIELRREFADDLPQVEVASGEIHQVIVNLATNAVHAIEGVGEIVFRIDAVVLPEAGRSPVPDVGPGGFVRLTVSDTGTGMTPAVRARIFDPFFSTKSPGSGTGLGLSVVHGIVKAHGGAITVESEPGIGTRFEVYLPAATSGDATDAPVVAVAPDGCGEHILFVDDEAPLVTLAERLLTSRGYRVTGYCDPVAAWRDFESRPSDFDAVVTDLAMPRLPGFALVERLRSVRGDIPVLLASGYLKAADEDTARRLGVNAILVKPNTMDRLGPVLDDVFRASRAARSAPAPVARG